MKDLVYKIAITKIPFVGPKLAKQLIAYCGGVEQVFHEKKSKLSKIPGIGPKIIDSILNCNAEELGHDDANFIIDHHIHTLFYLDKDYPARLKNFDDAPLLLYYKGNPDWNASRTVGIVGTRTPTHYGKKLCEDLVNDLGKYNVQVISGLAYGIDATAHQKANEMGIENLAIMGTGIDTIYPQQNQKIANKTVENGAILTEYKIGAKPDRENFPQRNRIIAMLSDAVVVVESKSRGGSLITAEFANAYNKDVFAFPGKINDSKSAGCNGLIKRHKAALIESAEDIAYVMMWDVNDSLLPVQTEMFVELDPMELRVKATMTKNEEITIDKLHAQAGINMSELSAALLSMEFKGIVTSLPGKRYILN